MELRKDNNPIIFWILMVTVTVALYWGMSYLMRFEHPAVDTLSVFTTRFLGIFIEAAPFLLLGSVASGMIESFVTAADLTRWIPRRIASATLAGAFMGFVFPVCECGVVPVVRRLYNKGLPMGVGIAFLLAAPVMNPIVLVSTYIAFGWGPLLIGRFVLTLIVALIVGLIFSYAARPLDVLKPVSLVSGAGASQELKVQPVSVWQKLINAMNVAADEFFEMGRYLIIGSMLAAAMQTFVSQDLLVALGQGPVQSVLVMQALAFLLSVCSTVDAFLALAFAGTFTTGSLLAFLTFGPMVDIKSLLMFVGVFRPRVVLYLLLLPFLMTMLVAIWMNLNWMI